MVSPEKEEHCFSKEATMGIVAQFGSERRHVTLNIGIHVHYTFIYLFIYFRT